MIAVAAYPVIRATYTAPEEGGDIDPTACPDCSETVDVDEVFQMASEKLEGLLSEKCEADIQRRRDGE